MQFEPFARALYPLRHLSRELFFFRFFLLFILSAKKILIVAQMSAFPYFTDVFEYPTTFIPNKCYHPSCSLPASQVCGLCPEKFCFSHKEHKHCVCCAIDQSVKCNSHATQVEDNYYYCDYHFEVMARAKCYKCGSLQPKHRREYKYCTRCVNQMESDRHGFWYSLREKGVSGPYGEAFKK
jgi:hypothetical protein